MKHILDSVKEFIENRQAARTWQAGRDFVNYAGAYYDSAEYMAAIESLLKGWLVMGDCGQRFEREFPMLFGKAHGL